MSIILACARESRSLDRPATKAWRARALTARALSTPSVISVRPRMREGIHQSRCSKADLKAASDGSQCISGSISVFVSPPVAERRHGDKRSRCFDARNVGCQLGDLRREFDDSKATIKGFRVETEEEGKERAKRLARKRPTVLDVEELDVVRFVSRAAETEVRLYLESAVNCIPDLDAMFEAEVPTLVIASYLSSGDGLNRLRTAVKGGEGFRRNAERKTRFVAALIHYWMERGKIRKSAEWEVAEAIGRFLKEPTPVPGFDVAWFASLIVRETEKETRLKGTYTKNLDKDRLRELAIRPRNDLPPLELFLPKA